MQKAIMTRDLWKYAKVESVGKLDGISKTALTVCFVTLSKVPDSNKAEIFTTDGRIVETRKNAFWRPV